MRLQLAYTEVIDAGLTRAAWWFGHTRVGTQVCRQQLRCRGFDVLKLH